VSVRLKDVVATNRMTLSETTDPDLTFRYVDIGAVSQGRIDIPDVEQRFETAPSRARRLAEPGDIVVSTVRTYLRAVARVPKTVEPLVFSTGFAVMHPHEDRIDSRYLGYFCTSTPFIESVVARSVGVSYPAINASEVADIRMNLPPLDEQRRIADFLDTETTRLDALIASRSSQLELFAVREAAALTETFEVDSTPRVHLGYLAQVQTGVTVGGQRPTKGLVERPYLRVANVQADRLELATVTSIWVTRQEAAASTLRPRDVLMTEGGDLDKLGRGTLWNGAIPGCLHQNHVFAIRCGNRILPEFLAYFTRSMRVRAYFAETGVKTTNLASTNSSKVRSLPVPLMSIEQQRDLAAAADGVVQSAVRLRSAIELQSTLLAERRQVLITAAVTGELDVTTARGASA